MHVHHDLEVREWGDYALLDSGNGMKLERFNGVLLARPEIQALWEKKQPELWGKAHASFAFSDGKGAWKQQSTLHEWHMRWHECVFALHLTAFKHIGVFPEQAANWEWVRERVLAQKQKNRERDCKVLNLFGYTGVASVVSAQAGAKVTHVDASKHSIEWGKENMLLSGLPEDAIRWILDDALVFARREAKRGNTYQGIILDPPAFGRGAKGEVWRIEEDLPKLMREVAQLLEPDGFLLINGYAAGYTPTSFLQLVGSHIPQAQCEYGELLLQGGGRLISEGIYVRAN